MNKPWRITFTGIDEGCTLRQLEHLLAVHPRVELGILYSETRSGVETRYPSPEWTSWILRRIPRYRLALHVCGGAVGKLIRCEGDPVLGPRYWKFGRVQLNGAFDAEAASHLRRFIGDEKVIQFITQYDANQALHDLVRRPAHQVLFDASGGRGVTRKDWPHHLGGSFTCGYAGGLGPRNLLAELPRIAAAAGSLPYWIDMESGVRDEDDRFSIDFVIEALRQVQTVETGSAAEGKARG